MVEEGNMPGLEMILQEVAPIKLEGHNCIQGLEIRH